MIQFAPKIQPETVAAVTAAKRVVKQYEVDSPVLINQSPIPMDPSDVPVPSLPRSVTKPAAEPLELSGEPAPKVKNGKRPRPTKGTGAKTSRVEQLDGNNLILPLEA
jgi:hypothetical protein